MSNLIVLLNTAVLATCLKRLPFHWIDSNRCGFHCTEGICDWQWPPVPVRVRVFAAGVARGAEGTAPAAGSGRASSGMPRCPTGLVKTHY